ncbi:MAG TPA: sigma-70 family RNA polymerase sigma factor [Candidatus Acidoferrum sp.]|jgi:RNA polymerase sigma-70 factor (ECF subfamily)
MHIDLQERDEVLLRRSAAGDEDCFTQLYRRHQAALFRFALRMTGNAWAAEEIVQDVFMTLVRDPRKYDSGRGTVGAFLYGVARNRIMKHLERAPRDLQLPENGDDGYAVLPQTIDMRTPAYSAELGERRERVRAAVLELPAEFREAVVLCLLEELSYEDASRVLDCPIGTIRSRLHRGRALLLAKLEILREAPKRAIAR